MAPNSDDLTIEIEATEPGYARLVVAGPEQVVAICFGVVCGWMGADEEYEKKDGIDVSPS